MSPPMSTVPGDGAIGLAPSPTSAAISSSFWPSSSRGAERRAIVAKNVAYHDACHLSHAQGVRDAPRQLLRAIPELTVLEIPKGDLCCGSAGIYNLTEPETASELGRRKAANISSLNPDAVAAANPGCLLQLRRHLFERRLDSMTGRPVDGKIRLVHPIELIAESIGALPGES